VPEGRYIYLDIDYNLKGIIHSLSLGKGLQEIIDSASEFICNPILVSDTSFKTLAYTNNVNLTDPYWLEHTQQGYSSMEAVKHYSSVKSIELVSQAEEPVYFGDANDPTSPHSWIIGKAVCNKRTIAFVSVCMSNKPFQTDDIEKVSILCDIVSAQLQRNNSFPFTTATDIKKAYFFSDLLSVKKAYFFSDLLSGSISAKKEIEDRMHYLDIHLKNNLYVLAIDTLNDQYYTSAYFTHIRNLIKYLLQDSETILFKQYTVVFFCHDSKKGSIRDQLADVIEVLKKYRFFSGLSMCFNNLIKVRKYYLQSITALELGRSINKDELFYFYDEYYIYNLLNTYSKNENIIDFCHPALFSLIEYDRENNTDYAYTLYAYLNNEKKLTKTANHIHLHRSSVEYRINKIKELVNIDLDNMDNFLHILLSFKILYMLKYIN